LRRLEDDDDCVLKYLAVRHPTEKYESNTLHNKSESAWEGFRSIEYFKAKDMRHGPALSSRCRLAKFPNGTSALGPQGIRQFK